MPKATKPAPGPIQKKVQEICNELLFVAAPELVSKIEENLVNQIDESMVVKAHATLLEERKKGGKTPPSSTQVKKPTTPTEPSNP